MQAGSGHSAPSDLLMTEYARQVLYVVILLGGLAVIILGTTRT
ncbi:MULTISPECIES: hypothetical protein [unclassified Streptomyces]|nr:MULTISPECIES: hypothetical protein [unclassified Streptomyces]